MLQLFYEKWFYQKICCIKSVVFYRIYFFVALFLLFAITFYLNKQSHDGGFEFFMYFGADLMKYWDVLWKIQFGLVMLAIIELIIEKRGKLTEINIFKIPAILVKYYPILFWAGILFVFVSFILVILFTIYK